MEINSQIAKNPKDILFSERNLEMSDLFTTTRFKGDHRTVKGRTFQKDNILITPYITIGRYPDIPRNYGILTVSHYKVFLVMVKLWNKQGRPINDGVGFSLYRIAKELGISNSGRNFKLIRRWLQELNAIPLVWSFSFFELNDQGKKKRIEQHDFSFHIVDNVFLRNEREDQNSIGGFVFSKPILKNLIGGYVKPVLLDQVLSIKTELALLIYQHIDGYMAYNDSFSIPLKSLCYAFGLSESGIRKEYDRKKLFFKPIEELKGVGLSCGMVITDATITRRGAEYWLTVKKGKAESKQVDLNGFNPIVVDQLQGYGLTDAQIARLIGENSEADLYNALELIPIWETNYKKAGERITNKAAFVYKAISEHWGKVKAKDIQQEQEKVNVAREMINELIAVKSVDKPEPSKQTFINLIPSKEMVSETTVKAYLLQELRKRQLNSSADQFQNWITLGTQDMNELVRVLNEFFGLS